MKFFLATLLLFIVAPVLAEDRPRLVLQITVDGLRADLVERYRNRYGEGGFNRLLGQGVHYANAHYQHANTETIVGHATLASGAHPARHGMTGNVWLDQATGELAYNIEDPDAPILAVREEQMTGDQVDPAQRMARTSGRSPRAMLAETFSDRLHAWTGGKARIFAVSGKDRGAVSMAGQAGKAFWYSTDSGDFVTSGYYYDMYPDWVAEFNAERRVDAFAGTQWTLLNAPDSYQLFHQDDRPFETDLRGYGRTFPHPFGEGGNKLLYTQLLASPHADVLTAKFAVRMLVEEGLGQDAIPDYLSVSFSGLDAVDHFFGPSSLENEDMMLRLDGTITALLDRVDERVGLDHVLVVLSADHGMPEAPEYMAEQGVSAGRLFTEQVLDFTRDIAAKHFGAPELVRFYFRPFLYLDADVISAAGLEFDQVARELSLQMTRQDGIHLAVATGDVAKIDDRMIRTRIANNIHPDRAGDIYVAQSPYWFNFDKGPVAVMHGSPWNYDTHVPVIFMGPGVRPGTVHREVQPADVAPTLAAALGMTAPASAQGKVLIEVVDR